jgi:hypothetical protein
VILEMYDEMAAAMQGGPPYQTRLDPPPADARARIMPDAPVSCILTIDANGATVAAIGDDDVRI